jgi:hypothetical protein
MTGRKTKAIRANGTSDRSFMHLLLDYDKNDQIRQVLVMPPYPVVGKA